MSNFLAVDTSSRYLTVAAVKGERQVVKYVADCAMQHSVALMDEIEKALSEAGLTPADCDYFVAVTGPGSFTGIRIGLSCVKGYAVALGKPAAGVTTFDMLSYNVNSGCDYLVAVDAMHGNFYVCGYTAAGACNLSPRCLSTQEIVALNRPVYGTEELSLPNYMRLDPSKCLAAATVKAALNGGALSALYVKKPQAEEERERRIHGL